MDNTSGLLQQPGELEMYIYVEEEVFVQMAYVTINLASLCDTENHGIPKDPNSAVRMTLCGMVLGVAAQHLLRVQQSTLVLQGPPSAYH